MIEREETTRIKYNNNYDDDDDGGFRHTNTQTPELDILRCI